MDFARRRFLRLAPAMYLASTFLFFSAYFIAERPEGNVKIIDMLPGLFFIEPYYLFKLFSLKVQSLDGAFWSLYIEVKFYLIVGMLFYVLKDKRLRVLLHAYLSYFAITILQWHGNNHWVFEKVSSVLFHLGFEHFGWFLIGILAFRAFDEKSRKDGLLLFVVALVAICHALINSNDYSIVQIIALSSTVVLFLLSFMSKCLQRMLSNRVFLLLGFISYPLYLIHQNTITETVRSSV